MNDMAKPENGFTLVELAIVMMIIGLLIGGVLKGQELLRNARVTATISQMHGYQAAMIAFQDTYSHWPGDMPRARVRLPGCSDTNYCFDGNGDGAVGAYAVGTSDSQAGNVSLPQVETAMFWKHLVLANLTTGVDPGADPSAPAWGETHPLSDFSGGFEVFTDRGSAAGISLRLQPALGGPTNQGAGANALSPRAAGMIDRKIDDGKANAGSFWAVPRGNNEDVHCANSAGEYYPSGKNNCLFHYKISGH